MRRFGRWGVGASLVIACVVFVFIQAQDPVHTQWKDRVALPSCGSVALDHGQSLRRDAASHFACLQDGRDSGGAELEVQRPTTEGDPTFFYYRVTPAGTTELYLDATRDIYSQGGWHFSVCENPSSVLQTDC